MPSRNSSPRPVTTITRPATLPVENEYDEESMSQYFQVCVNVLEARKLIWSRPEHNNSFVVVSVGSRHRRTTVRRNAEQPFYREYFVFEMFACARDVQRTCVTLAVMEPRFCVQTRLLGAAFVDLSAVWSQPHHQIFHKWAQLTLPKDTAAGPRGFLKVDISILCRGEVQYIPPPIKNDEVEHNLLPPSHSEQQRANYVITVYKAWALPSGGGRPLDASRPHNLKPPSTFVRITFCGVVAKTSIQPRTFNPSYNETIYITEMFPNVNQHVRFEVCSAENYCNKVLCTTHLRLDEISHDGENGFLPTFGPCPIHLYGDVSRSQGCVSEGGPYYRGALMLSLRTVVPYYKQGLRSINVEPTSPLDESTLWSTDEFYLFCPLLEVSMIDKKMVGRKCGIAITFGDGNTEVTRQDEEAQQLADEIKQNKSHYTGQLSVIRDKGAYGYLDFEHTFPVLQLLNRYPDYRIRVYRRNMLNRIVFNMESTIADVERRISSYDYDRLEQVEDILERGKDDAVAGIQKFFDIEKASTHRIKGIDATQRPITELDEKQLAHQKTEMLTIQKDLRKDFSQKSLFRKSLFSLRARSSGTLDNSDASGIRKRIKYKLAELKVSLQKMKLLIFKTSEGWPDIVMWLVSDSTRVAHVKISAAEVAYSPVEEQCGKKCAKFKTYYLKPIKCPKHLTSVATGCVCVAAKVEMSCWLGLLRQKPVVTSLLPESHEVNVSGSGGLATYVTANAMYIECRAFIYRAKLNGGADASGLADPFVRVNIFNQTAETQVMYKNLTPIWNRVVRVQSLTYSSPERFHNNPAMVLIEVYDSDTKGKSEIMGRVQIEAILSDDPDYAFVPKLQWFDLYNGPLFVGQILMSIQLIQITDIVKESVDDIESLPQSLVPESTTYKIDVYWWGLRDVSSKRKPCAVLEIDDLSIKSENISEYKSNCNFPNGRYTQTFEAPLKETYCPPLSIRLYDSGTFGRTVFLGTNVLKSPNKFIVDWIPKFQRDASLHSVSLDGYKKNIFGLNKKKSPASTPRSRASSDKPLIKPERSALSSKLHKWFSRSPTVATVATVTKTDYTILPLIKKRDLAKFKGKIKDEDQTKDWWMRFICSQKKCTGDNLQEGDEIVIYNSELEGQEEFFKFKDWCHTMKLYNGKKTGVPEKDEKLYCGYLKAGIAIYKWPPPDKTVAVTYSGIDLDRGYFHDHPSNDPKTYLVRVYVVKGFNLMPRDMSGKSDPYVVIKCGKKQIGDRKNYIPKNINPIFGRMFELRAVLPDDYLLTVSVYDYDRISISDDLIGSTTIDIEDRVFTKHRATCGLASEYRAAGYNQWRDCFKPSYILNQLCQQNHLPAPTFPDSKSALVNGIEYNNLAKGDYDSEIEKKENVCLNLLKKWHTLPLCGYQLVPEHVETRTLFNPDRPGLDQGKLQMWVDVFPLDAGLAIPAAVAVSPRLPEEYELRVVVWDVEGIPLDDYDFITGEKASDIYVKAHHHYSSILKMLEQWQLKDFALKWTTSRTTKPWIGNPDQAQSTDVHYRSVTGEGNFNWRMVFRFQYQHAERRLIFADTSLFSDHEEQHLPPKLHVVAMDNDTISADDYLGSLSLDLGSMPRGAKNPRYCTLATSAKAPHLNLFNARSVRGWWPLSALEPETGNSKPAGKIDLEIHLLRKEKAALQPVGLGREGPQPLKPPNRPDYSINLFTNPLAYLKRTLRRRGWKWLTIIVVVFLLFMFLASIFMTLPRILLEKLLD